MATTNPGVPLPLRALLAAYNTTIPVAASIFHHPRQPRRRARIPPGILLVVLMSACGQYDRGPCSSLKPVDAMFAVSDADFLSFAHDDGDLNEAECAVLCDCLSPVPLRRLAGADATTETDAGEVEAGGGAGGGMSTDAGGGGPRCFAESDARLTHWESCTYRRSAAGYRMLRCAGRTVAICD
jgi:hypothetical protein